MMVRNKISRIKAAVVSAAMIATTLAAPVMSQTVTAATVAEISKLPHTFIADGVVDGPRQANVALPKDTKKGDTIYLNFTTSSDVEGSIGVYGFGTDSSAEKYWYSIPEADQPTFSSDGKTTFECKVVIPTAMKGNPTKIGVGVWWPEDGSEWTLESIKTTGGGSTGGEDEPATPNVPGTENDKSGTCSIVVDKATNTAEISATLSAQYTLTDEDGKPQTQFDYLLTQGIDEEDYGPYLDENGEELEDWKEGDPINSHKFEFANFGIKDMENIEFESFEYAIKSDDYTMSEIQYGGGINVKPGSPADTEFVKGKDGYWYNDQGNEDAEKYGDKFGITDYHGNYVAENCGGYAKVTWDVPEGVQPHVDFTNNMNAVGFQYWWGKDDTKTSTNEKNEELNYAVIPEIHLLSCTATYTRRVTVPYTDSIQGDTNVKLVAGEDKTTNQIKFPLADLELGERDRLSAIEFTFESEEALSQFVGGCGISVDESKAQSAIGIENGWYQSGNLAVINCEDNTFKVMWILPSAVRNAVYPEGEVLIGAWYADVNGEPVGDITISDIKYHVFRTQEEDLVIGGEGDLVVPDEIEITVGDTYELDVNVDGATFESDRETAATVDENGVITGVGDGLAHITVKTPEGQEKVITVIVNAAVTTAATTTTAKVTTTKTTTTAVTTVDPDTIVDWSRVLYGDVDVNGKVELADLTALAKHLASKDTFPLKNATATENADCSWDQKINTLDLSKLIEFNLRKIGLLNLGPEDKSNCPMYETPEIKEQLK